MTETLDFRAFGKNDIRGIYGEDVTEELFYYAARGYVNFVVKNINKDIEDEEEKIDVKDKDLNEYIEKIAKRANKSVDEYKKTLTEERLNYITNEILMNKLLEFLVEKNK